jgi:hypothetical protein
VNFLLDNHISPKLARALDCLYEPFHHVFPLREKFPQDAADTEWIPALGQEGNWVAVTIDTGILKKPTEKRALIQAHVTSFFLERGWSHLSPDDMAWRLVRCWPHLLRIALDVEAGLSYRVPINFPRGSSRLRPLTL